MESFTLMFKLWFAKKFHMYAYIQIFSCPGKKKCVSRNFVIYFIVILLPWQVYFFERKKQNSILRDFSLTFRSTLPNSTNILMTSNTPVHLQPRWRFNYRFDAANTEEYSSVPTCEQIKNLYMKSGVSMSQPRQIPFLLSPARESSSYVAQASDSVINNRQHVVMDHTKETKIMEHGRIKQMENPFIQNINVDLNLEKTNIQQESLHQNSPVEKTYRCIERLNSKMSPNLSANPFVSTTIPSVNGKEIMMNSGYSHERHVILPGGMYANLSDVYVESLPNYTEGDKGSCLVMSLSNVLKKTDMLEKYYFSLKEENRQLQSMVGVFITL
jgi:hypothetical protein